MLVFDVIRYMQITHELFIIFKPIMTMYLSPQNEVIFTFTYKLDFERVPGSKEIAVYNTKIPLNKFNSFSKTQLYNFLKYTCDDVLDKFKHTDQGDLWIND